MVGIVIDRHGRSVAEVVRNIPAERFTARLSLSI